MESCDIRFEPMSANSLSSDNPEAALSVLRNGGRSRSQQQAKGNKFSFQNDDVILVLEPNLDLLVSYHEFQSPSSATPTTTTSFNAQNRGMNNRKNKRLLNQHPIVSAELRHLIYVEQRKYSIKRKEEKMKEIAAAYPVSVKATVPVAMEEVKDEPEVKKNDAVGVTSSPQASFETMKPVASHGLASFLIKRPKESDSTQSNNKKAKLQQESTSTTKATPAASIIKKEQRVHYKFNEGFSNAVKRTVYLKDFL